MASTRTFAKSVNLPFLQDNNKIIYVSLLIILTFFLFLDYIPGMHAYSAWVTPPVALFLGLLCYADRHILSLIKKRPSICCSIR